MDQEFDKVENEVGLVSINTIAACKHVAEIEGMIRVIRERSRVIMTTLPYTVLPCQFVIHIIFFAVSIVHR